ncbi:hypothetical protein SAMN05216333_11636 [Nitrosomonas oligotropha]|uniref:Uncharacterized protein n=1 Tax=Nitrosomonas oligotropha TaxID=42354 RepID=A0A1H8S143_9PROT|nr:hypothetical protein SAMN05216300_11536 [Nitrosomonas oligotropha]SEO72164.1 hypothetical protein SAMN05216333_11636 [Nitrosomonas oligotropha]
MMAIFNYELTRWRSGFAARCLCGNVRKTAQTPAAQAVTQNLNVTKHEMKNGSRGSRLN